MKEFKINDFITLHLEDKETIIYVAGKRFQQCKFLLLNIIVDKISTFNEIESIDEAAEKLDRSLERLKNVTITVPAEVEFWGHCSNLQVWFENNYDTRLLHANLAFPLLKKLTDAGDPLAKMVFKEEIAKRLTSNHFPVVSFLTERKYLLYLELDELIPLKNELSDEVTSIMKDKIVELFQKAHKDDNNEEQNKLFQILSIFCKKAELQHIKYARHKNKKYFINNGFLRIDNVDDIREIQGLNTLKGLKRLSIRGNKLSEICYLEKLIGLEELGIRGTKICKIKNLDNLYNLKILDLGHNQIIKIEGLDNLNNLERLYLDSNNISEIKGLEAPKNLIELSLDSNQISEMKGFDSLRNLTILDLNKNCISKIEGLNYLTKLKVLHLNHNQIKKIEGLDKLYNLNWLNLVENEIVEMKGLEKLKSLQVLILEGNNITKIKGLKGLRRLELLDLNGNKFPDPYDNREYEEEELDEHTF